MEFVYNDGGRAEAGFKGKTGDCVTRAIAIATGLPYRKVYDDLNALAKSGRTKGHRKSKARTGVAKTVYRPYLESLGWRWVPTMLVGSGCKVHLADGELPKGRLVVRVSKHMTAVINSVINDTWDPQREFYSVDFIDDGRELAANEWRNSNGICSIQRRCVYGYFIKD